MMNGESGAVVASVAMRSPANQFELVSFGLRWPGLVAGKLAHICERLATASSELKSRITGRSSARGNLPIGLPCRWMFAPAVLYLTLYEPLG
jgi:hypothetical protein